jgi:ribonuclease HIII
LTPAVVKITPSKLQDARDRLLKSRYVSEVATTNQYELFRLRCEGGTIIAYTSGKIVATGQTCEALLQSTIQDIDFGESEHDFIIGSDEAGKGEWLGPLVVAAVGLTPKQSAELRALGVMDSKGLSINRIASLSAEIEDICQSLYLVTVPPQAFNKRLEEFREEGKNLNDLLAWAHAKAVSEVYKQLKRSGESLVRIVIDEFSRLKTQRRLERVIDLDTVEVIQKPRAEDVVSVAAASIVARNAREDWIKSASDQLGMDLSLLKPQDARKRNDLDFFAKTSYLKE